LQVFALNRWLCRLVFAFLCHPGFVFSVIPALSRDPLHAAGVCKGLWSALGSRVFARDDKSLMDVSTSSGRINSTDDAKAGLMLQGPC
jgi:hypothetical protein